MQGVSKHLRNLVRLSFQKNTFFIGKKHIVKTISVAITHSSGMRCFGRCLINIVMKTKKAERCTDIMLKLALHCLSVIVEDLNLYIIKI